MRLFRLLSLALSLFVFVSLTPQVVLAIPVQPMALWGDVTLAGMAAPDGVPVTARIGGTTYATVSTLLQHSSSLNKDYRYSFLPPSNPVPSDDPDTPAIKEGGVPGDPVQVYVDQALAGSTTFGIGKIQEMNLIVPANRVLDVVLGIIPPAPLAGQTVTASGVIRDKNGAAVGGAAVDIDWGDGSPVQTTTSGTDGIYSLTHMPLLTTDRTVSASATSSGYVSGRAAVTLTIGTQTVPDGGGFGPPPVPPSAQDIEKMSTGEAIVALNALSVEAAAGLIAVMAPAAAAAIIAGTAIDRAIAIVESLPTGEAAEFMGIIEDARTADILGGTRAVIAAGIMEKLSDQKLARIVPNMTEESLLKRLPLLTPDKLYSIPPAVLFSSLPHAPTEQLVGEKAPAPPPDLDSPAVVYTTPTGARYLAIRSVAGEWVIVMATPEPLGRLLIKTTGGLANIGTTVDILPTPPAVAAALPTGTAANLFFAIDLENATSADIAAGHITFKVARSWMEQNSIDVWSVTLAWYNADLKQWLKLPTKRVKEDGLNVHYSAVVTHFSTFAITGTQTVPSPGFKASDLVITPATAMTGEPVTVGVNVTNTTGADDTFAMVLWVNGTVEAARNIAVKAGDTVKVSFNVVKASAGTYNVRVDRLFGSFKMEQKTSPPATTPTSTPPTSPTAVVSPPPGTPTPSTAPPPATGPALTAPTSPRSPSPAATPPGEPAPVPTGPPTSAPEGRTGMANWMWIVIGIIVVGIAIAGVMKVRRPRL